MNGSPSPKPYTPAWTTPHTRPRGTPPPLPRRGKDESSGALEWTIFVVAMTLSIISLCKLAMT